MIISNSRVRLRTYWCTSLCQWR